MLWFSSALFSRVAYIFFLFLIASVDLALQGHGGFAAGTRVATSLRMLSIDLLVSNQTKVLCIAQRARLKERQVIALKRVKQPVAIEIRLGDECIVAAPEQLFFSLTRSRWVPACELTLADELFSLRSQTPPISTLSSRLKSTIFYKPTVQQYHNFFVSKYLVLVHNAAAAAPAVVGWGIEAVTGAMTALWAATQFNGENDEWEQTFTDEIKHRPEETVEIDQEEADEAEVSEETDDDEEESTPPSTIDDILEDAEAGKTTGCGTKQFIKGGGYDQAEEDFASLQPDDVFEIDIGQVGTLPDGRKAIVRIESTDTRPTLEIQSPAGKSLVKVRYNRGMVS